MYDFILYSLAIIVICTTNDILSVMWTKSINEDKTLSAVLAAAAITLSGSVSIVSVSYDPIFIIPNVIGHSFGTFIGLKFFKKK